MRLRSFSTGSSSCIEANSSAVEACGGNPVGKPKVFRKGQDLTFDFFFTSLTPCLRPDPMTRKEASG